MTLHKLWIAACSCLAAGATAAEPSTTLVDVASRLDYGFYARDTAVIDAARSELEALPQGDPWRDYFRAYSAMRLVQLGTVRGRDSERLLDACLEHAESAAKARSTAVDGWVLVAACSGLAADREPVKAPLHERRAEHALRNAKDIDARHPRLQLVEAWRAADDPSGRSAVGSMAAFEAAVAAFSQWPLRYSVPAWGEAEAHAALGEAYLLGGDSRLARDHLEQALVTAPDYRDVLDLLARLQSR